MFLIMGRSLDRKPHIQEMCKVPSSLIVKYSSVFIVKQLRDNQRHAYSKSIINAVMHLTKYTTLYRVIQQHSLIILQYHKFSLLALQFNTGL